MCYEAHEVANHVGEENLDDRTKIAIKACRVVQSFIHDPDAKLNETALVLNAPLQTHLNNVLVAEGETTVYVDLATACPLNATSASNARCQALMEAKQKKSYHP